MVNTMPRDKLGRIVYESDVLDNGMRITFIGKRTDASDLEIDLAASPDRTNYERYFADLGTREEVQDAYLSHCSNTAHCSDSFAFYNWGRATDEDCCFTCEYFPWWLDKKAVI